METEQDRDMISQVREALKNRDEVLIVYVSISSAVVINSQPVADQRHRVPEYHSMRTHCEWDDQTPGSKYKRTSRLFSQQLSQTPF